MDADLAPASGRGVMHYYKLLRTDGLTLTGRPCWTVGNAGLVVPGPWVEAHDPGRLVPYNNGVHVLAGEQLCYWAERSTILVEVAVDGEVLPQLDAMVVRRARPLRLVSGWTDDALRRWAYACVDRAVRIHAQAALMASGRAEEAERLSALPRIVDEATAMAAWTAIADQSPAHVAAYIMSHTTAFGYAAVAYAAAYAAAHAARADQHAIRDVQDAVIAERAWQSERLAELVGLTQEEVGV